MATEIKKLSKSEYLGNYPYDHYSDRFDSAIAFGWGYWIDGIPVHRFIKQLYEEFKHKNPTARIRLDRGITSRGVSGCSVYSKVAVVFQDAPDMVRGWLGAFEDANAGAEVYGVQSPLIKNNRYNAFNKEYHIKTSKDFRKAKTLALSAIKPANFAEVAAEAGYALSGLNNEIVHKAESKLKAELFAPAKIMYAELFNMINAGYTPVTGEFKEMMKFAATDGPEVMRQVEYRPALCFVWLLHDSAMYRIEGNDVITVKTADEFPEGIRDKLSVLQLTETATPIMDVGIRVDATKFWVFV